MTHPSQPNPTQARIAELAQALAAANPDAAEELARHLAHHAVQLKAVRGLGLVVRFNAVTGRVELTTGGG